MGNDYSIEMSILLEPEPRERYEQLPRVVLCKLHRRWEKETLPDSQLKTLLLENIHPRAAAILSGEGFSVEALSDSPKLFQLERKVKAISILGVRSKTRITSEWLERAPRLLAIGAFCVGTEQIDLQACARQGVVVFNAPFSNTRSVVELALGEMIMLIRGVFDKSVRLHKGQWCKSSAGNYEIRGKRIGIIGYGKIGSQLSVLAEAMGMEVYFYDLVDRLALGNARRLPDLKTLLKSVDIVSVHVDGRVANRGLIGANEFAAMRDGALFLNLSRGFVVDLKALAEVLKKGKIAGAAIDVFQAEPLDNQTAFISELQGLPNVILTPHIGGSTEEAQAAIAEFVPGKIIDFIKTGSTVLSTNFPNLQLPELNNAHRLIHVHNNVPGIMARINSILAANSINIEGQYLKTNEQIGYVITDISRQYEPGIIAEMRSIPGTIRFRILY
jgi:D-3-phosphoglycerate dehydrogenase